MLKLKLQYFGHLMWRTDSLEKTLMLGKIEGRKRRVDRGWDGWMASSKWLTWVWVGSGSWWWTGKPGVLQSMGSQRVGHNWATELNWTKARSLYIHNLSVHVFQKKISICSKRKKKKENNLPIIQILLGNSWHTFLIKSETFSALVFKF